MEMVTTTILRGGWASWFRWTAAGVHPDMPAEIFKLTIASSLCFFFFCLN